MRIENTGNYLHNTSYETVKQTNVNFDKSVAKAESKKVNKEDMSLEEYKQYFQEKMDGLYRHPSQKNMNWVIDITDNAYKRMQTDPAYEQKILDALATNKAVNFGNNIPVIAYTHVDDTWDGCYGYTRGMKENNGASKNDSDKKGKTNKEENEKEEKKLALNEYLEKRREQQELLQEMRTKEYFKNKEQQAYWNKRQMAATSYEANIMER